MKKILFLFILLFNLAFNVFAQQTKIVVAIAEKSTNCISSDLGYQVYYGDINSYEIEKRPKPR